MKRRYLAMVLGLVLAVAPTCAFAEESSNVAVEVTTEPADGMEDDGTAAVSSEELIAVEEAEEDGEMADAVELKEQFWGNVTAVDETSITIAVGTLGGDEMPGAGQAGEEMPEKPAGEENGEGLEDGTEDSYKTEESGGENADDAEVISEENADDAEITSGEIPENVATTDEERAENAELSGEEITDEEGATGEENAAPEQLSAYDALELTGEEMTIAITEDTEVYFVYGDTDIVGLKMTARDFAGENGGVLLEMQAEDAGEVTDAEVTGAEDAEATDIETVAEEDAEATDIEAVAEEDAETTDAKAIAEEGTESMDIEAIAEEAAEVTDIEAIAAEGPELSTGEMNKMHTLELDSASAESIIPEDLVNITLDEDGNAAVILIVMPQNEG